MLSGEVGKDNERPIDYSLRHDGRHGVVAERLSLPGPSGCYSVALTGRALCV